VSSIVFVRGLIDKNCSIFVDERSPLLRPAKETIQPLRNEVWRETLIAAGALSKSAFKLLSGLPEGFTVEELGEALEKARAEFDTPGEYEETKENLLAVAHGNYDLEVPEDGNWSELVIFPTSQNESRESKMRAWCGSWMTMVRCVITQLTPLTTGSGYFRNLWITMRPS
jgi:hypothetical protein